MAEAQARRAIALDPEAPGPYDRLGQALEGRHQPDEARRAYAAALDKDRRRKQRTPWPAFHLGRLSLELGLAEEAAAALAEALEIDPNHVDALYEQGMALRKLERWEAALASLERAAGLNPAEARIQYALSQTYQRLGRRSEASEAVRRFRALSPQ